MTDIGHGDGDALAPANRLAYPLSKRTVAQPDATKRPARMYGGPFLRLGVNQKLRLRLVTTTTASKLAAFSISSLDCDYRHDGSSRM